MQLMLLR